MWYIPHLRCAVEKCTIVVSFFPSFSFSFYCLLLSLKNSLTLDFGINVSPSVKEFIQECENIKWRTMLLIFLLLFSINFKTQIRRTKILRWIKEKLEHEKKTYKGWWTSTRVFQQEWMGINSQPRRLKQSYCWEVIRWNDGANGE